MFNRKELVSLLIAALVIGYVYALQNLSLLGFLAMAGLALIMIFIHVLGQKFTALFYDCSTESSLWTIRQFWLKKGGHFKFDFPAGVILPVFLAILTLPFIVIKWLALTTFEAVPLPSRVQRKYAELTEFDLALIAVGGLFFNAILAVISQAFGWNDFAMMNLYFIAFNLLPISTLDGSKIFFGSVMLWIFSVVFAALMLILIGNVSVITTIIAAVILAFAAVVLYYTSMNS